MFIKDKEIVHNLVKKYKKREEDFFVLGNNVLYDLCKDYSLHNDRGAIVSKVWLIGRSYAAALERVKDRNLVNGAYYNFSIEITKNANLIDEKINCLNKIKEEEIFKNLNDVFQLHGLFTDIMKRTTGLEKRSLSSKYLHFHCPNVFYIYDSRARQAINALVKKQNILNYLGDSEYIEFYLRVLELKNYIKNEFDLNLNPREIDNLLVFSGDIK